MQRFAPAALLVISSLAAAQSVSAAGAPMRLARTIPLPATESGKFDHLAVDSKRNRAILTAEAQHALLVVDLQTGRLVKTVGGFGKPHAVFYRPDLDRLYVTDGAGSLVVLDAGTYRVEKRIALRRDADSIGFDPSLKRLYVDNGGQAAGLPYSFVSVVDTTSEKKLADIRVEGDTLEAMALDLYRPRLYVNDPAKNAVVVIDRWTRRPIATWPVTLAKDNVALALDEQRERLFVGCRSGKIVVFNSTTGKELQAFPTPAGIDDLAFDPARRRLYAAGDGAIAVYQERDADHYVALGQAQTGPRAVTGLAQKDEYLTVVPAHGVHHAALLVLAMKDAWKTPNPAAPFAYDPNAPAAERLVMTTLSEHPFLRKLGLHGIKPGESVSVLLANGNMTRRGIRTTDADFAAVASKKQYAPLIPDGEYYNVKLPMFDASGRRIGLIVMEIPASAAPTYGAAIQKADAIRAELSRQIPTLSALFAPA